jgi:hypothetical protein
MSKAAQFALSSICCFLVACVPPEHVQTGPVKNDVVTLDVGKADRANIELDMRAGELNLSGVSDKLMRANFSYNVENLKPVVRSENNGTHSIITIRQPDHSGFNTGHVRNTWDVQLNTGQVLWDVSVHCGAGKAQLGLGSLNLRSVSVQIGVGQVDLNLEGSPQRDYEVNISGGVGQAIVHLPKNVGIRAEAHGGIGSIDVEGLHKQGDQYENDLYDKAKVNVRLKVDGGIGQIRILA